MTALSTQVRECLRKVAQWRPGVVFGSIFLGVRCIGLAYYRSFSHRPARSSEITDLAQRRDQPEVRQS